MDDGSTDGSGDICDRYASSNSHIKCVHQKNSCVSAARNAGLTEVSGSYVWFCDSDDRVCIKRLLKKLKRSVLSRNCSNACSNIAGQHS